MTSQGDSLQGLRDQIDEVDRQILELLAERNHIVDRIAEVKKELGMQSHQPVRFHSMMDKLRLVAEDLKVDTDLVVNIWNSIHDHSLEHQTEYIENRE